MCVCVYAHITHTCHTLLTHSFAEGQLSWLRVLALWTTLQWAWEEQSSHRDGYRISLTAYPGAGVPGHRIAPPLLFWGNTILLSTVATPVYVSTDCTESFFLILANTGYLLPFWEQPSWQVWGDSPLSTWLAVFWWLETLSTLLCTRWPFICFASKCLFRSFANF